jgi:hypothetical protein
MAYFKVFLLIIIEIVLFIVSIVIVIFIILHIFLIIGLLRWSILYDTLWKILFPTCKRLQASIGKRRRLFVIKVIILLQR